MEILCLDVGTEQSAYCLMDIETYKPLQFGKIPNEELIDIVRKGNYKTLVYEEFKCYGMAIGDSTIRSITWNGRYIQIAADLGIDVDHVIRMEEKSEICHDSRAKDANIRKALISRFAQFDFENGKGTKKNPDWFFGFKADCWSAYAVGVTYLERAKRRNSQSDKAV